MKGFLNRQKETMTTKIIIIRHGFSETNKSKKFTGQMDIGLSDVGKKQAELVSSYLYDNYKIDKIYSSDLSRAVNTIKPLADKLGTSVVTNKGLREIYGGKWEGVSFDDISKLYSEDYIIWTENVGFARPTGGESFAEGQERIVNTINEIVKREEGNTVVIVSHGGVLRGFECFVQGKTLDYVNNIPYFQNASISLIEYDGVKMQFKSRDFTEHLGELHTAMPKGI